MKQFFAVLCLLLLVECLSQPVIADTMDEKNKSSISKEHLSNSVELLRWKKAVVHLETATDGQSADEHFRQIQILSKQQQERTISKEDFVKGLQSIKTRDIRARGTAVLFQDNNRRYLITARHVLFDKIRANHLFRDAQERIKDRSAEYQVLELDSMKQYSELSIYNIIFRVQGLDEVLQGRTKQNKVNAFLMNLGAGSPESAPYTFSEPAHDLAIISLDQRNKAFADELLSLGYEPISLDDIGDEPSMEGTELFAIGFPGSTSIQGQMNMDASMQQWASSFISVPTTVFGRVSMLHKDLPYFLSDMSIYPGNSGGPVIEKNKLVGIVSKQPYIPIEEITPDGPIPSRKSVVRIPFGHAIKAKFIKPLLEIQRQKDAHRMNMRKPD